MVTENVKEILEGGLLWHRRTRAADQRQRERREILGILSKPGCAFCRRERTSLERFLFWYLHEGYGQRENVERMRLSHGFCPRHTVALLAKGAPHEAANIYAPLLSDALAKLRLAETKISASPSPEHIVDSLKPRGVCLACSTETHSREYLSHLLGVTLDEAEVREALRGSSSVCLAHFVWMADALDWEQLRFFVETTRGLLGAPDARSSLLERLKGADLEEPYLPRRKPEDAGTRRPGSGESTPRIEESSWSPTVMKLRWKLTEDGCLVCLDRRRALGIYFDWLSEEVREQPYFRWSAALGLCREHAWGFARRGDGEEAGRLTGTLRDDRAANLERLADRLQDKPPDRLVLRLAGVPRKVREKRSSATERKRRLRTEVMEALDESLKPPEKILPGLRAPALRVQPCPACGYLETTDRRVCDLLVRGLGDPETLRLYEASSGLCFRHLPVALGLCTDPAVAKSLLRAQRTRLELLQWELHEYGRKQNWTVRYEPKGPEQDAWRRAVGQYAGV